MEYLGILGISPENLKRSISTGFFFNIKIFLHNQRILLCIFTILKIAFHFVQITK